MGAALDGGRRWRADARSLVFPVGNRGKQSVAIDIASAEGQALIRAMVPQCDVLIENYKAGSLAKYGLDHASLRALHPA